MLARTSQPVRDPLDDPKGHASAAPRAGSLTLREGTSRTTDDASTMLDPANQSLSDALNVLLRLIYVGVVVLFVLYLFSGVRRVQEGERGVRLLFGRVTHADLQPGLQLGPPFPLGELVRVSQGLQDAGVNKDFWVFIQGADNLDDPNRPMNQSLDQMQGRPSLKPDEGGSGSILTGDGNIVHARWAAKYRRTDAKSYAENVLPSQEVDLVKAAVKRGVVRACAEVPIDTLLRQSGGGQDTVGARAREIAQQTLDDAGTGIVIETLSMSEVTPPLWVRKNFQAVQSAVSRAQEAEEKARTEASGILNRVAGDAAPLLIDRIDAYEAALAMKDTARGEALLEEINRVLMGERADFGGSSRQASGEVMSMLSSARAYRSSVASESRSRLASFQVLRKQYEQSPLLMVHREWRQAVSSFTSRPTVTQMFLPGGGAGDYVQLLINQDPTIRRDIEKRVNEQQAQRAMEEKLRKVQSEGIKTETPLTEGAQ